MISGYVLAKPGEKISKSKNNGAGSPMALIERHSADAIRYWAANSKLGTDTFFDEDELNISRRFIRKLYNAAKFAILQLGDFSKPESYDKADLLPVDRWILQRVNETTVRAAALLDDYEIGQARHEIDNLFWKDFCDYYIEIAKERLYQPDKHGQQQRYSGQIAVYYSLLGILKLYAIYTPYVTEYIYQEFYRQYEEEISLHLTLWETGDRADRYRVWRASEKCDRRCAPQKDGTASVHEGRDPGACHHLSEKVPRFLQEVREGYQGVHTRRADRVPKLSRKSEKGTQDRAGL